VARAFSSIRQRSQDLLKLNIRELEEIALRTPDIAFHPHNHEETAIVVGRLSVDEILAETPATTDEPCSSTVPTETWDLMDDAAVYADTDADDGDDEASDATFTGKAVLFLLTETETEAEMSYNVIIPGR